MGNDIKYISKNDFHNGKEYAQINGDIDFCLTLIERLISYNKDCKNTVKEKLKTEILDEYIDYRADQFSYYENTLKSIYYGCCSLRYVYDISTFMSFKGIESTILDTYDNQVRYITFTALVKMSSIFEYTRSVYEEIKGKGYFEKLRQKYFNTKKIDSLELLNDFRNTIHSNGKWNPKDKNRGPLKYTLREGKQTIMRGEVFKFDYLFLYKIIKDCLELNKLMALDNETPKLRFTKFKINGKQAAVIKTNLSQTFLDNLFNT